jgi:hypothetical protein
LALISVDQVKRLDVPHEPDQWIEVRPVTAGDLGMLEAGQSMVKLTLEAMSTLIKGWSYPEPATRESVNRLDVDTFIWLSKEIMTFSGVRDDAEKND